MTRFAWKLQFEEMDISSPRFRLTLESLTYWSFTATVRSDFSTEKTQHRQLCAAKRPSQRDRGVAEVEQSRRKKLWYLLKADDFCLKLLQFLTPPPLTPAAFLSKPVKLTMIPPVGAHGMRPLFDIASHLFSITSLLSLSGVPALRAIGMEFEGGRFWERWGSFLAPFFRYDVGGTAFLRCR